MGQAMLRASAVVPRRATDRREKHAGTGGGGRPAWHQALFAHPRKEEINIDTGLLRHSLGKPAPEPRLRPCPSLTLSSLPTLCQLPGLPRPLPGLPTWQLGDSPSYLLSLGMEQKLQPGKNGAC